MALTKSANRMITGASANVLDYGAVGDGVTDDTAAFNSALTAAQRLHIPKGKYVITSSLAVPTGDDNIHEFFGDSQEQTILLFDGVSGISSNASMTVFRNFSIVNKAAGPYPSTPVEGNISAGIIGLRIYGNSHLIENVRVQGFDTGFKMDTKYYNTFLNCVAQYNLTGFYNTDGGNFNRSYGCKYSLNFNKNVWVDGGSHSFNSCSIEGCTDYDNDLTNYPNGGVLIGAATITYPINTTHKSTAADFNNCYTEDCNWYINNYINVSGMKGGTNARFCTKVPLGVSNFFQETGTNLLPQIWHNTWAPGNNTITNSTSYYDEGFRYSIVNSASGVGSKYFFTPPITAAYGLIVPDTASYAFTVYFGIWIKLKTANFTESYPEFMLYADDKDDNDFNIETPTRTNRIDNTLVDEWQYLGFLTPARYTFSTGEPIVRIICRISLGDGDEDHSASNRIAWFANPDFRLLFTDTGHSSGRANDITWQELHTGTPRWDSSSNVTVGTETFPTGADNTFTLANPTSDPTGGTANGVVMYSNDLSAGHTIPAIYTEGTNIVGSGTPSADKTVAIKVNGTVYYLLASTVAS